FPGEADGPTDGLPDQVRGPGGAREVEGARPDERGPAAVRPVHDLDRSAREGYSRVEGTDVRVVPGGYRPEIDVGEHGTCQVESRWDRLAVRIEDVVRRRDRADGLWNIQESGSRRAFARLERRIARGEIDGLRGNLCDPAPAPDPLVVHSYICVGREIGRASCRE